MTTTFFFGGKEERPLQNNLSHQPWVALRIAGSGNTTFEQAAFPGEVTWISSDQFGGSPQLCKEIGKKTRKRGWECSQLMVCSECCKQTWSWADNYHLNYHSYNSLIAEIVSGIVQLLSSGLQVQIRPLCGRGQVVL